MLDSSSVTENAAGEGGGGIYNVSSIVTLRELASVIDNSAFDGGGIENIDGTINACDGLGVDKWVGAISPNAPDDPPTPTLITCT